MKNERHAQKLKELNEINEKIYKLEERMVNEEIETSTYQTWFKKLQHEKRLVEAVLNSDEKSKIKSDRDIVERLYPRLENLFVLHDKSNVTKSTLWSGVCSKIVWYGVKVQLEQNIWTGNFTTTY